MKRFLIALALVALGASLYVAAAPGSPAHAGPTWRQFNALQKKLAKTNKLLAEVATVVVADNKQLTQVATTATADHAQLSQVATTAANDDKFITTCLLTPSGGVAGSTENGDFMGGGYGFAFYSSPPGPAPSFYTGALQLDFSGHPQSYFQRVDPNCIGNGTEHVLLP